LGLSIPLLMAVATIPPLIEIIGLERFGLLSLAWGMIGYAGVFDLGIGRATTQIVAGMIGKEEQFYIPDVIKSAINLTVKTGFIGFALISIASFLGVQNLIQYSAELENEITISLFILAAAIPLQAISATYKGVNEAFENFFGINALRVGLGSINFLGPFFIAQFTSNLSWLLLSLLISRLMALFILKTLAIICVRKNINDKVENQSLYLQKDILKRLFSFGAWFTISNIISPILLQLDRFFIAIFISATAVAAYMLPYQIVVQSLILVGAVTTVAFPRLTRLLIEEPTGWKSFFFQWVLIVFLVMSLVTIGLVFTLPKILPYWIGKNLPDESIQIGQTLCIGVLFNSIGSMYFALLHAKGRSDLTAKIHLLEIPIFIIILFYLINILGIFGAAWAWTARMAMDTFFLFLASRKV